ncbi:MAG TPA: ATP cone domain-containing protein [Patescibacteria group bacterium]|nr:ATP cone domain-containing protein [Patescibacteria group bacterium]
MNCPFCGSYQVMVTNSRANTKRNKVWRRRKCLDCENTFTTYEYIHLSYLTVIKNSGKKQKYNRAKLYASIYHSCLDKKGVDRGDISQFTEKITNEVESKLLGLKRKTITTIEIKAMVLKTLRKRSPDTLLRYLAYREGNDRRKLVSSVRKYFLETKV